MNLIQKRYHVAGDTPCHLKVGNGKCGYFYKSFDDLNQHIKNFHKPQCDLSKSEEEQIFESPETSPAEKKTFDFEQKKSQSVFPYVTSHYSTSSKKNHRQDMSTPPLTPLQNDSTQLQNGEKIHESEEIMLNYSNKGRASQIEDHHVNKQNYNCSNLQSKPNHKNKVPNYQIIPSREAPFLSEALHVDVGNDEIHTETLSKDTESTAKRRQLLQVVKRTANNFSSASQQTKHPNNTFPVSTTTDNMPITSHQVADRLNTMTNTTIEPKLPPPSYLDGISTAAYNILPDHIQIPMKESYLPVDMNSSQSINNYSIHANSKIGEESTQKSSDIYSTHSSQTYANSHLHQLTPTDAVSKRQSTNGSFNDYFGTGFSQVINQPSQFQPSNPKGYQLPVQDVYNNSMDLQIPQESSTLMTNSSRPIPGLVHSTDQIHNLQQLQYMQQWQQQHTSKWNFLSQHMPTFSRSSIIPAQLPQSNTFPAVETSPSNLHYIPSMMYGNYASAASHCTLSNSIENMHQQPSMMQESMHPLNPLIQQVKSIVNKAPKKTSRYPVIPSSNNLFHASQFGHMHRNQPDKQKCNLTSSDHKCLLANCCGQGKRGGKRKRVQEKENLNSRQLEEMKNMEWEKREGYKCKICDVRFLNQQLLIDHLSENKCKRNAS